MKIWATSKYSRPELKGEAIGETASFFLFEKRRQAKHSEWERLFKTEREAWLWYLEWHSGKKVSALRDLESAEKEIARANGALAQKE